MSETPEQLAMHRLDREERAFSVVALALITINLACVAMVFLTAFGVTWRP